MTFSQSLAHLRRQVNGSEQVAQSFCGKFCFACIALVSALASASLVACYWWSLSCLLSSPDCSSLLCNKSFQWWTCRSAAPYSTPDDARLQSCTLRWRWPVRSPSLPARCCRCWATDSLPHLGPLDQLVASYGLAIVCFLAGAHWGTFLSGRSAGSLNLFVISNAIFLAVWFAYVGAGVQTAIGMQIVAFLALLLIDLRLRTGDVISATYLRVRTAATLIAVCVPACRHCARIARLATADHASHSR